MLRARFLCLAIAALFIACTTDSRIDNESPRPRRDAGVTDAGTDAGEDPADAGEEQDAGTDPVDAGPSGCRTNADCDGTPATPVCESDSGECVECLTDTRCPTGYYCSVDFQCVEPEGCNSDFDCGEGKRCTNRQCVAECTFDADCANRPNGSRCDPRTNACVKCWQNNHCGTSQVCHVGQCILATKSCTRDLDCSNGQVCAIQPNNNNSDWVGGKCVPAVGASNHGGPCKSNKDCRSGFCRQLSAGATDGYCIGACNPNFGSADCDSSARCRTAGERVPLLGPDGRPNTADDIFMPANVCSTRECVRDSDCAGLSADPSRPRVCAPRGDPAMADTSFLTCMPRAGNGEGNQVCVKDSDCATDTCLDWKVFTPRYRCFKSCASASDCTGTGAVIGCTAVGNTSTGGSIGACGP